MSSSENEVRLFVAQQREGRRLVAFKTVAAVASVEVRRSGELPGVTVSVTVRATLKFDLEQCVLAFGNMALGALHPGMSALQRIRADCMFLHGECRRFPSIQVVAGGTLSMIRPFRKLPVVRIGLVTVHALFKSHRLFKVATCVALSAVDGDVLSNQWK